jgi:hypothetical protein
MAWGRKHTFNTRLAEHKHLAIPVFLHADGAEYVNNSEAFIFSWFSGLTTGGSWDSKFLICAVPNDRKQEGTLDAVARVIIWSLRVCEEGVFPSEGPDGSELDGPRMARAGQPLSHDGNLWRLGLAGIKSDLKAKVEMHKYKTYWLTNWICERCFSHRTNPALLYSNWKDEIYSLTKVQHHHYLENTPPEERSVWCSHPDFDISRCVGDLMHLLFLGLGRDVQLPAASTTAKAVSAERAHVHGQMSLLKNDEHVVIHCAKSVRRIANRNLVHDLREFHEKFT